MRGTILVFAMPLEPWRFPNMGLLQFVMDEQTGSYIVSASFLVKNLVLEKFSPQIHGPGPTSLPIKGMC
jgi:hypothetical protein